MTSGVGGKKGLKWSDVIYESTLSSEDGEDIFRKQKTLDPKYIVVSNILELPLLSPTSHHPRSSRSSGIIMIAEIADTF